MKKIIAAAAGLMLVGVMASSASAVESKFGGYWRTRGFSQIDFKGDSGTYARVDTRTRLYYTAVFNENFKFVNRFEYNAVYGDTDGGDIGTDGNTFRVKHSYVDVTTGNVRSTLGLQGAVVARGFIFDDDFAGAVVYINAGDTVTIPLAWMSVDEKEVKGNTRDYWAVMPVIKVSDAITLNPYLLYDNNQGNWDNWYAGIDFDMKGDAFSGWGTFIYNFGTIDAVTNYGSDSDISAWLMAAGFSAGPVHGQAFYASGDDDFGDKDTENFVVASGQSYYWAEIMGLGIFDNQASAGSPANNITNIWAANIGVTIKPMDKLTLTGDMWYASLVENNAFGDDELGWEFDAKATYAIMDNLNLDLVAAYLFAGDATAGGDDDPIEVGARVSLSF